MLNTGTTATGRPGEPVYIEERLYIDRIGKLSEHTLLGVAGTVINSAAIVAVLWNVSDRHALTLWFSGLLLIAALRVGLHRSYGRIERTAAALRRWNGRFLLTLAISGLVWGSAAFLIFPDASIAHQSFLAFVIGGMVAGAVGVFSVMMRAFLVFSIPALSPIIVRFFLLGDPVHLAMGFMTTLFWLIMAVTAKRMNGDITRSFLLKYENSDLVSELRSEVETRKAAEAEILRQKADTEDIVAKRTSELREANRRLTSEIEDRRRMTDALRESEEQYRDLVESINDVIFSLDVKGFVGYVSPVVTTVLGYSADEMVGKHFSRFVHEKDLKNAMEHFEAALRGESEENEYRLLTSSGNYRWVRLSSKAIQRDGAVSGLRGAFQDISQRKRFELETAHLEARLKQAQKMESIGTLAGGIAHDFNNILFMMIGNAELGLIDAPKGHPLHDKLEAIRVAGLRASGIVKQLLAFSRNADKDRQRVDAVAIVKESLSFLRSTLPSSVSIRSHLPAGGIPMLANPVQIHQVMINVCTNAAQAMEAEGGVIDVRVDRARLGPGEAPAYLGLIPGDYAILVVRDTGPGIDPKYHDRIFDPYFTTKPMGQGSGMGLSVVHGIVDNHGGAIRVDSRLGEGTTFTIYLPLAAEPEPEAEKGGKTPRGRETILCIDDEETITELIQTMLEGLGYRVVSANDPARALEVFRTRPNRFDLVISDMTMPKMTGVELSSKLKEVRPDLPVVITTGHSTLIDERKAGELGIAAFIMKPIVLRELARIVREVLDAVGKPARRAGSGRRTNGPGEESPPSDCDQGQ